MKDKYKILPECFTDWDKGYEIQATDKVFISWDMPIKEMIGEYAHFLTITKYGEITFNDPIRVGNMIFERFQMKCTNVSNPTPFSSFVAYCNNSQSLKKSFKEIYQNLRTQFGKPGTEFYDSNKNLLRSAFNLNGVQLICYKQGNGMRENVLLRWINKRTYPYLLEHHKYQKEMVIAAKISWPEPRLYLADNYKSNLFIKQNPLKMEGGDKNTIIWRDDINKMIGFANGDKAHLYPFSKVKALSIQNVADGRIGFGSSLRIHLQPEIWKPVEILHYVGEPGAVDFFDQHRIVLERLIQKTIKNTEYLS